MTTQELHDIQVAHFSKPGVLFGYDADTSEEETGGCVYRGPNGRRCAVGCAIPYKLYSPMFEGKSADSLIGKAPHQLNPNNHNSPEIPDDGLTRLFEGVNTEYLRESQRLHDDMAINGGTVEDFVVSLKDLARKHGLEVSA